MGSKERREREKIERRNQILDAARTVLFKKGITATSMNLIAKESELSVGTLYLYFTNKEELFAALQQEGLDILIGMIEKEKNSGGSPSENLGKMALAYYEFSDKHRKYFDIMNYFLASPQVMFPADLKAVIDNYGTRILLIFENEIKRGVSSKEVKDLDIRHHAIMVLSTLHGLLQFRKLQTTIFSGKSLKELYVESAACLLGSIEDKFFQSFF